MSMRGKKWLLRGLLILVICVLLFSMKLDQYRYLCYGIGFALSIGWAFLYRAIWRCPHCDGILPRDIKGTRCPHCGEDVGESIRI